MGTVKNEENFNTAIGIWLICGGLIWIGHKTSIVRSQNKKVSQKKYKTTNPVMPLNQKDIERAKDYFLNKPERYKGQNLRDYTMFCLNINIGLKPVDLVNLKISDIWKNGSIIDTLHIKERNKNSINKPVRVIILREELRELLKHYLDSMDGWDVKHYLFSARGNPNKAMGVRNINYKMHKMKDALSLDGVISSLSMAKTFSRQKTPVLIENGNFNETIKSIGIVITDEPNVYKTGDII